MKIRAIVNPASGRESLQEELLAALESLCNEGEIEELDLLLTEKGGDAYEYIFDRSTGAYDICLVAGGDGTANEAVNGLIKGDHQTPLALLAAGTVNDFATSIGLPQSVEEMVDLLRHHELRQVDVGQAGDNYFINVCAAGLLTDVAYRTSRVSKAMLGRMAYVLNAAVDFPLRLFRPYHFRLTFEVDSAEQEIIEEQLYTCIVANSTSVGGFNQIAPNALIEDGLLEFLGFRSSFKDVMQLVPLFLKIKKGEHLDHPAVLYRQIKSVKVEVPDDLTVHLDHDGEKGSILPATIQVCPRRLNLAVAAGK